MKRFTYQFIVALTWISITAVPGISQPLSAIEFKDTTGTTPTARIGWTGTAANGHFFVKTPTQPEVIKSTPTGIEVGGEAKATSFSGSGSGLTASSVPIASVNGLNDSLGNKAQKSHTHAVAKVPWDSVTGKPAGLLDSIPDNSITSAKVMDSSLTGADISDSSNLKVVSIIASSSITANSITTTSANCSGTLSFAYQGGYLQGGIIGSGNPSIKAGAYNGNFTFDVQGNIAYSGTIGQSSDVRYKKALVSVGSCLGKVNKLEPFSYLYEHEKYPEKGFSRERQIGLIAQDVEPFFPELVQTDDEGYKSIDYSKLSVVLLKALQEQQQEIEKQAQEIGELKAAINK